MHRLFEAVVQFVGVARSSARRTLKQTQLEEHGRHHLLTMSGGEGFYFNYASAVRGAPGPIAGAGLPGLLLVDCNSGR